MGPFWIGLAGWMGTSPTFQSSAQPIVRRDSTARFRARRLRLFLRTLKPSSTASRSPCSLVVRATHAACDNHSEASAAPTSTTPRATPRCGQAAELLLPLLERRRTDPVLPATIRRLNPRTRAHDHLTGSSSSLRSLPFNLLREKSSSEWSSFRGQVRLTLRSLLGGRECGEIIAQMCGTVYGNETGKFVRFAGVVSMPTASAGSSRWERPPINTLVTHYALA
jgi:hypothetical protein